MPRVSFYDVHQHDDIWKSDPSALVTLSPYQLEQAIAQIAAEISWLAKPAKKEGASKGHRAQIKSHRWSLNGG